MKKLILPSNIKGCIDSNPSKSETQRYIAAALLSDGTSLICNPSLSDDSSATIDVARKLGARINIENNKLKITGGFNPKGDELNCKESGLALRMFSAVRARLTTSFE